jgi:hypothetical protein
MRKVILYRNRGVPALTMKLWIEHSLRQQIGVYATQGVTWYLSEEIRSTACAPGTRSGS